NASAASRAITLRYFSRVVYAQLRDGAGHSLPIKADVAYRRGQHFAFAGLDFAGSHRLYARFPTASDHVDCAIVATDVGQCRVRVVIGHSVIRGDSFRLDFAQRVTRMPVTSGTGRYRGARGTITASTPSTLGTDLTIRVRVAGA